MKHSTETIAMIIRFYNMQAETAFRCSNEYNQAVTSDALERVNDDIKFLKEHIRAWVNEDRKRAMESNALVDCMAATKLYPSAKEKENPVTAPAPADKVADSLGILEQALMEVIKKQSIPEIEKNIKGECLKMLQDFIQKEYGTIERKIVTVIDGKSTELPKGEILHSQFDKVLQYVANDEPVYLVGPAGSGKNVICKQVANALNLHFYHTNSVTQEYKLIGFTDANGNYQPTPFYEAFTKGGLFMLDEMDASIPETLIILNATIANRYFTFPAPIGQVEAHPNFRVIAAGNTIGHGADNDYVGRTQLDYSTLTRFGYILIDYCVEIENKVAGGDIELADFCRDFRKAAKKTGIQIIVSYREIGRLAKFAKLFKLSEALDSCLLKGLGKDDINIICSELPASKYKEALRAVAS